MKSFILFMCLATSVFGYTLKLDSEEHTCAPTSTATNSTTNCNIDINLTSSKFANVTMEKLTKGDSLTITNNSNKTLRVKFNMFNQNVQVTPPDTTGNAAGTGTTQANAVSWRATYSYNDSGIYYGACTYDSSQNATTGDKFYPVAEQPYDIPSKSKVKITFSPQTINSKTYLSDCSDTSTEATNTITLSNITFSARIVSSDGNMPTNIEANALIYPTMIIGDTDWAKKKFPLNGVGTNGATFICPNNVQSLTLRFFAKATDTQPSSVKIPLTINQNYTNNYNEIAIKIPNDPIITNYRKMFIEVACKNDTKTQRIYFDARPYALAFQSYSSASNLYAGYKYSYISNDQNSDLSAFVEPQCENECLNIRKSYDVIDTDKMKSCLQCLRENNKEFKLPLFLTATKTQNGKIVLSRNAKIIVNYKAYDGSNPNGTSYLSNQQVNGYSSTIDMLIANTLQATNANHNISCAASGECTRAYIDMVSGESASTSSTDYVNGLYMQEGDDIFFRYDSIGQTAIFGADASYTAFSQAMNKSGKVCIEDSTSNTPDASTPYLIGCNVPVTSRYIELLKNSNKAILFSEFLPFALKVQLNLQNSDNNATIYGNKNFTLSKPKTDMQTDLDFEMAKFDYKIMAISASKYNYDNNISLRNYGLWSEGNMFNQYDADNMTYNGSVRNPIINYTGSTTPKNLAYDFNLTLKDNDPEFFNINQGNAVTTVIATKNAANQTTFLPTANEKVIKDNDVYALQFATTAKDKFIQGTAQSPTYYMNLDRNNLIANTYAHLGRVNKDAGTSTLQIFDEDLFQYYATTGMSIMLDINGSIDLVDGAIIAPDLTNNDASPNAAVYLGGYCINCKAGNDIFSSRVPNYISYFGFDSNVFPDGTQMFDYIGATFNSHNNGADYLTNLTSGSTVTVQLKGDNVNLLEKYCNILRNCTLLNKQALANNRKFGLQFKVTGSTPQSIWHGKGDREGQTVIQDKNRRNTSPRINW